MPNYLNMLGEQLGSQAATSGLGTVMGLMLEKHNDKRQLAQQRKLQELEMEGQRKMGDYNYAKQLEMWNATGYKAQMEQLKKATKPNKGKIQSSNTQNMDNNNRKI